MDGWQEWPCCLELRASRMVASSRVGHLRNYSLSVMLRIGNVRSVAATILLAEMSASSAAQRSHPDELSLNFVQRRRRRVCNGSSRNGGLVHVDTQQNLRCWGKYECSTAFTVSNPWLRLFGCGAYPHGREAGESRCSIGGMRCKRCLSCCLQFTKSWVACWGKCTDVCGIEA